MTLDDLFLAGLASLASPAVVPSTFFPDAPRATGATLGDLLLASIALVLASLLFVLAMRPTTARCRATDCCRTSSVSNCNCSTSRTTYAN